MVGRRGGMGIVGVAATAKVVNNRSEARRDAADAQQEAASAAAAPAAAAADDPIAQVKKLAELHAAGALTDEEFSAAKAKALGI
jgi:membrane protease subunit (stomatin/prohibitin family)